MVEAVKGGLTTTYAYNADGVRTRKTSNGITTRFTVDSNRDYAQVILENSANDKRYYHYGDDLISQYTAQDGYHYYGYDGLGSTQLLTDEGGAVAASYRYDAWGELLDSTGDVGNPYLFTGEQYDADLDQYYLRARYYDQNVGRFTQMDTWMGSNFDPPSLHKYTYAHNDPVFNTDPTGNFISAGGAFSAGLTIYSVASTSYQVFQIATGKEEMPTAREMGSAIVMNLLFRGAGKFAAKQFDKVKGFFKSRNGERVAADCLDNSFLADTLVDTARGYINIQDVEVGDLLWSFSEDSERTELKEVVHLIKGEGERNIVVLTLSTEDKLQATDGHLLYLAGEKLWKKASEIDTGDELLDRYGNFVQVVDIEQYSDSLLVYNLTVEDYHTYYVSKSSVLSHNCGFVGKNVLETLTKNTTSNPVKRGKQYSGKTGGMTQAESEFELMISRYGIKPNSRMTLPKGGTKVQLLDGSFMTLERGGSGATIYLKVDGKQHKIRYEQ